MILLTLLGSIANLHSTQQSVYHSTATPLKIPSVIEHSHHSASVMANDQPQSGSGSLYSRMLAPEEATLPQVYTTVKRPYIITFVNSAWERLCGFTAESAIGRTSAILQGERTCKRTLDQVS